MQGERIARSITRTSDQSWALARLAEALARAGFYEQAEQTARALSGI